MSIKSTRISIASFDKVSPAHKPADRPRRFRRSVLLAVTALALVAGISVGTSRPAAAAGFNCAATSGSGGSTAVQNNDIACGIADTADSLGSGSAAIAIGNTSRAFHNLTEAYPALAK